MGQNLNLKGQSSSSSSELGFKRERDRVGNIESPTGRDMDRNTERGIRKVTEKRQRHILRQRSQEKQTETDRQKQRQE